MPLLVPHRLSEVELLKQLGAWQWQSLATSLGQPAHQVCDELGQRLAASLVSYELCLPAPHRLSDFDEGSALHVRNRVAVFGKRLVEGLFVLAGEPPSEGLLEGIHSRDDLRQLDLPWAYLTNAFVAHQASHLNLVLASPATLLEGQIPELAHLPPGIVDQTRAERTGEIEPFVLEGSALPLEPSSAAPIFYQIVPESDLNGAGLLYCARFVAIMDYGERVFLTERLTRPLSLAAVMHLSCEQRRVFYFGNASPSDALRVRVEAAVVPAPHCGTPSRLRVPFYLLSRLDLERACDGVLIASARARKALCVPGNQKSVLMECERLLARLART